MKLSEVNKILKEENLPQVSRQQALYMMNKTPDKCKNPLIEGVHHNSVKRKKYDVIDYTDDGVTFLRQWSIVKKFKERKL